ncbi:MAG: DUF3160 domain-containing protein [Deltaproteobacteria bacterium]|nr:DUF3160 domain-containing protein [Deltaproteobacteria bacterium]
MRIGLGLLAALALAAGGCGTDGGGGGGDPGGGDLGGGDPGAGDPGGGDPGGGDPGGGDVPEPGDPGQADWGEVALSPDEASFVSSYLMVLEESEDMTTEELFAKHYQERPYLAGVGVDALAAGGMDLIDGALVLTKAEKDRVAADGFAVLDRVRFANHPLGYLDIYQKDLPLLVTADSILFAIHKSYDEMLKQVEEKALIAALDAMLATTHGQVVLAPSGDALLADATCDADLLLAVARSLLAGKPVATVCTANAAKRDELIGLADKLQPVEIELFGRPYPCVPCSYDFSQFKPRGHYTETDELKRYFRSMIWLGRTQLMPTRFQRELVASGLLLQSLEAGGAYEGWKQFDAAIRAFVGKSDNLTFEGLEEFLDDQGADDLALRDPVKGPSLMAALEAGGYADQRIMSQIMMTDPTSSSPTALPPAFAFLGQRFVIDSYVFNNVTYDRIVFEGAKIHRYMPSPLDPMFVLGFQEALPLLKGELDGFRYAGNLNALRYLVDSYDAAFWTESMYNVWLDAIRGLAADTTGAAYPQAARTKAYALKSMHAGLASWAELRHDTILYVKQSYTGEVCDYPDAYVEPFPEFYSKIAAFATVSRELFESLSLPLPDGFRAQVAGYFGRLSEAAGTLAAVASAQAEGEARTPEQTAFLRSLVMEDNMCGGPPFTGWYRDLFFDASESTFEFKPTIADVHTDSNSTDVLHVGTGWANPMVFVADTSCGVKAYVGPVSSYFEHREPGFGRLTDEEWIGRVENAPRPEWTGAFVVK